MTFDLTPEQKSLVANAVSSTPLPAGAVDAVLVVEERLRRGATDAGAPGFDQAGVTTSRARLLAAAAALGIGRAAVEHALALMRQQGVKPGPDTETPHWTLADGATDIEAARLLTYAAAQAVDRGESADDLLARALEFASQAAQRAVDAAIRVSGAADIADGGLLDRLARQARRLPVALR
jgi:alkylation response protein AidB-like acyl-CoA dehydrogenase